MNNREFGIEEMLDRGFTRHGEPTQEQVTADLARVRERLEPVATRVPLRLSEPGLTRPGSGRLLTLAAAAVLVMAAALGTAIVWRPADTALYRVVEGNVRHDDPPSLLRSFGGTGTIRSNGGGGAVLALSDGSRVEMRSNSELAVERTSDGIRIRLRAGGIIVNAAKQRTGHLYVQTKDMTVSVVGTVFVVNADDDGSRVAVVEGEVRVQQGATETKVRPGERVATSPRTETFSVASELAWSRRAEALMTLMRQSAAQPAAVALQAASEPRVAFEAISIRPSGPAPAPAQGARGGGNGANSRPSRDGCVFDSFGYSFQIDPRRFAVNRTTLLHLVAFTVPDPLQGPEPHRPDLNCMSLTKVGLLSGGPDWIRSDVWDVVATIPAGAFTSTPSLTDPAVQRMIRTMLTERFGLAIRRETREMPVYLLKVGKDGPKFNGRYRDPSGRDVLEAVGLSDADGCWVSTRRDNSNSRYFFFKACSMSMAKLAVDLSASLGRPVLDQTGLMGRFAFSYGYYDPEMVPQLASIGGGGEPRPRQEKAVEEIGLRVEEGRAPIDVWVIERAEKPSEN